MIGKTHYKPKSGREDTKKIIVVSLGVQMWSRENPDIPYLTYMINRILVFNEKWLTYHDYER